MQRGDARGVRASQDVHLVGPRETPARAAITQSPRLRLVRSSATAAILVPVCLGAPTMVQDLHGEGLERSMHARRSVRNPYDVSFVR